MRTECAGSWAGCGGGTKQLKRFPIGGNRTVSHSCSETAFLLGKIDSDCLCSNK